MSVASHQSIASVNSQTSQDADAKLEKMLHEAERLAAKMRSASSHIPKDSKHSEEQKPADWSPWAKSKPSKVAAVRNTCNPPLGPPGKKEGSSLATGRFDFCNASVAGTAAGESDDDDDDASIVSKATFYTTAAAESLMQASQRGRSPGDISAALSNARQMALALEALGASNVAQAAERLDSSPPSPVASSPGELSTPTTKTSNKMNAGGDNAFPLAPPPAPPSHKAVEAQIQEFCARAVAVTPVKWERVQSAAAGDDDFVPLQDYSSPSSSPAASPLKSRSLQHNMSAPPPQKTMQQQQRRSNSNVKLVIVAVLIVLTYLYSAMYGNNNSSVASFVSESSPVQASTTQAAPVQAERAFAEPVVETIVMETTMDATLPKEPVPVAKKESLTANATAVDVPTVTLSPFKWLAEPQMEQKTGPRAMENQRIHSLLDAMLQ